MQKENLDLESPHDCLSQCFACNEIQDYKINLAKFHGVCESHKKLLETNSWIECKACETSLYVYEFQLILCDYCMINQKLLALECDHKLCQSCIQEISQDALICPICSDPSENDANLNEIINNVISKQDFASEYDKSYYLPKFSNENFPLKKLPQTNFINVQKNRIQNNMQENPNKIIQNIQEIPEEIMRNPQEIPNEIIQNKHPSRLQCQKCFIGVILELNEKQFQCQNCDKIFCGKCFKCLTGKNFHFCKNDFFGNGSFVYRDLWKKNEFLRTYELMIQICPCCNVLNSYRLKKGFIVTCRYPLCKLKPRFCLYCGKGLNLGEEMLHFDEGENYPCRNVRLGVDSQKKKKFTRVRLQYFDD